jgi:hypothetical protein
MVDKYTTGGPKNGRIPYWIEGVDTGRLRGLNSGSLIPTAAPGLSRTCGTPCHWLPDARTLAQSVLSDSRNACSLLLTQC